MKQKKNEKLEVEVQSYNKRIGGKIYRENAAIEEIAAGGTRPSKMQQQPSALSSNMQPSTSV